ncbi:LysR substrate-binding domain-containing protein [Kocuria rhizophila]|nr:LysR substrate-binding domain-containing protein [Kocuria rhizophila]
MACPVGVGARPTPWWTTTGRGRSTAALLTVEPDRTGVARSLRAGEPVTVDTSAPTMMAGLNRRTRPGSGGPPSGTGERGGVRDRGRAPPRCGDLQGLGRTRDRAERRRWPGCASCWARRAHARSWGGEDSVVLLISTQGAGATVPPRDTLAPDHASPPTPHRSGGAAARGPGGAHRRRSHQRWCRRGRTLGTGDGRRGFLTSWRPVGALANAGGARTSRGTTVLNGTWTGSGSWPSSVDWHPHGGGEPLLQHVRGVPAAAPAGEGRGGAARGAGGRRLALTDQAPSWPARPHDPRGPGACGGGRARRRERAARHGHSGGVPAGRDHPVLAAVASCVASTRDRGGLPVGETDEARTALPGAGVDVVIAESYPGAVTPPTPGVVPVPLLEDPLRLVVSAERAAPPDPGQDVLGQLADAAWAGEPQHTPPREWWAKRCRRRGFEPRVTCVSEDLSGAGGIRGGRHVVAVLPELALGSAPEGP